MGSVVKYSAVITKLRAMYSRLLSYEDYMALSSMSSVGEVIHYLKGCPGYSDLLSNINEATTHRGSLEHIFSGNIIHDAKKLSSMLGQKEKKVLNIFLLKYEIDVIKRIVQHVCSGREKDTALSADIASESVIITKGLKTERCFAATDLKELADALSGTDYADVISEFVHADSVTAADIGTALDDYYFRRLQNGVRSYLSGSDRATSQAFLSAEIDVFNIMWIYRYKKYYDMTPEEIVNRIIPEKKKTSREKLVELAGCDISEYKNIVSSSKYGNIFEDSADKDWDKRFAAYLHKMYHRQLRNDSYSFNTVLAYLHLKEMDINNIITVVEGVRYGVGEDKIRKYINIDMRR